MHWSTSHPGQNQSWMDELVDSMLWQLNVHGVAGSGKWTAELAEMDFARLEYDVGFVSGNHEITLRIADEYVTTETPDLDFQMLMKHFIECVKTQEYMMSIGRRKTTEIQLAKFDQRRSSVPGNLTRAALDFGSATRRTAGALAGFTSVMGSAQPTVNVGDIIVNGGRDFRVLAVDPATGTVSIAPVELTIDPVAAKERREVDELEQEVLKRQEAEALEIMREALRRTS
ncbi:MAG: hypothetical protein HOV97_05260 [Nonomuraea sp.]|nr:hypothetical protein [Nonomuraea sp.]